MPILLLLLTVFYLSSFPAKADLSMCEHVLWGARGQVTRDAFRRLKIGLGLRPFHVNNFYLVQTTDLGNQKYYVRFIAQELLPNLRYQPIEVSATYNAASKRMRDVKVRGFPTIRNQREPEDISPTEGGGRLLLENAGSRWRNNIELGERDHYYGVMPVYGNALEQKFEGNFQGTDIHVTFILPEHSDSDLLSNYARVRMRVEGE